MPLNKSTGDGLPSTFVREYYIFYYLSFREYVRIKILMINKFIFARKIVFYKKYILYSLV